MRRYKKGRSQGISPSVPWAVLVAATASPLGVQFLPEGPSLCSPCFLRDPSTCWTDWPLAKALLILISNAWVEGASSCGSRLGAS